MNNTPLSPAAAEAIATADAHLNDAGLPTYTELLAMLGRGRGKRWRHVKRATSYAEVLRVELQAACPVTEGETLVIYRGEDAKGWARPVAEFEDGRFVLLDPSDA